MLPTALVSPTAKAVFLLHCAGFPAIHLVVKSLNRTNDSTLGGVHFGKENVCATWSAPGNRTQLKKKPSMRQLEEVIKKMSLAELIKLLNDISAKIGNLKRRGE